ncbi:hypothetical protein GCM10010177_79650 [Actinomadura citrea]|nr:hypothetical protein GCM10010177_79650 [Actinomadura citrea]
MERDPHRSGSRGAPASAPLNDRPGPSLVARHGRVPPDPADGDRLLPPRPRRRGILSAVLIVGHFTIAQNIYYDFSCEDDSAVLRSPH